MFHSLMYLKLLMRFKHFMLSVGHLNFDWKETLVFILSALNSFGETSRSQSCSVFLLFYSQTWDYGITFKFMCS